MSTVDILLSLLFTVMHYTLPSVLYPLYSVTNKEEYGDQSQQFYNHSGHTNNQLLNCIASVQAVMQCYECKTVQVIHLQSILLG